MPAPHHSIFLQAGCSSWCQTNNVKALKHNLLTTKKKPLMYNTIQTGKCVSLIVGAGKLLHKELDELRVWHEALEAGVHEASVTEVPQSNDSWNTGTIYARTTTTACRQPLPEYWQHLPENHTHLLFNDCGPLSWRSAIPKVRLP